MLYVFFSSRRRHTRLQGDWSSDVCSSDLTGAALVIINCRQIVIARHVVQKNRSCLAAALEAHVEFRRDRKSTRLNSSHLVISYAVFCLKKKKKNIDYTSNY